MIQQIENNHKR